jgi:ABC-type nitrate/sulfonate/bicarbonate transport system substrate-binding protein
MNRRRLWTAGAATATAGVAAAALWWARGRRPAALPLQLARLKAPHSGLIEIALERGFFADEGLAVTLQDVSTGREAILRVLDGAADVGTASETPIARALAEGRSPRVLATIFSSQWNSAVVGRVSRGVQVPADLVGKRIAYVPGTATHFMLETLLAFHTIALEQVTMVAHPPERAAQSLLAGEVDALSIWNPFLAQVRRALGADAVVFSPKAFYSETFNLVVRPGWVQAERERTDRLLRALLRAEQWALQRPSEAKSLVAMRSGMEPQALSGDEQPLTHQVALQQSLLLAMENEVRWHFRRGLVPPGPSPDVLAAFETAPLRALKPGATTIAR